MRALRGIMRPDPGCICIRFSLLSATFQGDRFGNNGSVRETGAGDIFEGNINDDRLRRHGGYDAL